jgi:hypothetical protein
MSRLLDELTNAYNQSESVFNLKNALCKAINRIIELEDAADTRQRSAPDPESRKIELLEEISGKLDALSGTWVAHVRFDEPSR